MTPEEEAEKYRYIKIKQAQQQAANDPDIDRMDYEDASKGDVVAEIGRSLGRGGQYAAEFGGDIYDVARASVDQFIPGADDRSILDQLNPNAPDSPSDIARQEVYDTDAVKFLTEEKIKRGGSAGLDAAKTFSEYVLPTITGGGAGTARKLAADVAATGIGAAGGEYLGNLIGGSDSGEIGEVIGAISGGLSSGAMVRKLTDIYDGLLKRINPKTGEKLTDAEVDQVVRTLMVQADNPEQAVINAEEAFKSGDKGTLADLTQDPELYNIEALGQKGSSVMRGADAQGEAIDSQILERVKRVTGENSGASEGLANARRTAANLKINAVTQGRGIEQGTKAADSIFESNKAILAAEDAAANAAQDAQISLQGAVLDVPMSQQSNKLAATYNRAESMNRSKQVQPLWDKFDAEPDISMIGVSDIVEDMMSPLSKNHQRQINTVFKNELEDIKNLEYTESANELHDIISSLKGSISEAAANGKSVGAAKTFMGRITKQIEGHLEASTAGPSYVAARKAESTLHKRFNEGGLGKTRKKVEDGRLLASGLAKDFEAGAVTADYIRRSGSPAIIKQAQDTLRALANRDAKTPEELNAFLRKYDEILTEFPDVKTDLLDAQTAQGISANVGESSKGVISQQTDNIKVTEQGLSKSLDDIKTTKANAKAKLQASILNKYAENATDTLDKILSDSAPLRQMEELIASVGKTSKSRESLKAAIGDRFLSKAAYKEGRLNPKLLDEFNKVKPQLEKLMDADELEVIEYALKRTNTVGLRKSAAVQRAGNQTKEFKSLLASGVAAMAMNIIPGSSLIMAGAVRRVVKAQLAADPDPLVIKGLQEMVDNPERFRAAFAKYKQTTPETTGKAILQFIKESYNPIRGARGAADNVLTAPLIVNSGDEEEAF
jgi:hypothetical protein